MSPVSRSSGVNASSIRKRQAGPLQRQKKGTMELEQPAVPVTADGGVGNSAHPTILSQRTSTLPVRQARAAKMDNREGKPEVVPLTDAEMIDLFGPLVPSDDYAMAGPLASAVGPLQDCQNSASSVGTQVSAGESSHKTSTNGFSASSVSPKPGMSATRRRVAAHPRSSGSAPSGRASPALAHSQSRSRSRGRRPSLYQLLDLPGAYNPFFVGTSPSIMMPPRSASAAKRQHK
ncbi:hypothetical protein SEPCBS119000_002270 [Sporothrix epigloea]|uniref:Uncharacterized protein n=1 Tax=Sporothrix epigloea TaxID=1892477 RepID=A0ABP0DH01_9PEZI